MFRTSSRASRTLSSSLRRPNACKVLRRPRAASRPTSRISRFVERLGEGAQGRGVIAKGRQRFTANQGFAVGEEVGLTRLEGGKGLLRLALTEGLPGLGVGFSAADDELFRSGLGTAAAQTLRKPGVQNGVEIGGRCDVGKLAARAVKAMIVRRTCFIPSTRRGSSVRPVVPARSKIDDPLSDSFGDRLHTICDVELFVDVLEMGADGRFGEAEDFRGLVVRKTLGDDLEDFQLAVGEDCRHLALWKPVGRRLGADEPEQGPGEVRLDHRAASVHILDRLDDFFRPGCP